jgi:hypothetical protein
MAKRKQLNRAGFITAAKLRQRELDVEDVGVVLIQELTARQRMDYIEYLEMKDGKPSFGYDKQVNFSKFIASLGVLDPETGQRMFTTSEDVPDLRSDALDIIVKNILILSGILPSEVPDTLPNGSERLPEALPES